MRKPLICLVMAVLLAGLLPLYVCETHGASTATEVSPLEQNERLWQGKHIQDYSYRLDIGDNFRPPPMGNFLVSVKNSNPSGYIRLDEPSDTNNQNVIKYDTFEKVFAILEQSYKDSSLHVDVTYDLVYGFPTSMSVYSLLSALDIRDVIKISDFTPK